MKQDRNSNNEILPRCVCAMLIAQGYREKTIAVRLFKVYTFSIDGVIHAYILNFFLSFFFFSSSFFLYIFLKNSDFLKAEFYLLHQIIIKIRRRIPGC